MLYVSINKIIFGYTAEFKSVAKSSHQYEFLGLKVGGSLPPVALLLFPVTLLFYLVEWYDFICPCWQLWCLYSSDDWSLQWGSGQTGQSKRLSSKRRRIVTVPTTTKEEQQSLLETFCWMKEAVSSVKGHGSSGKETRISFFLAVKLRTFTKCLWNKCIFFPLGNNFLLWSYITDRNKLFHEMCLLLCNRLL